MTRNRISWAISVGALALGAITACGEGTADDTDGSGGGDTDGTGGTTATGGTTSTGGTTTTGGTTSTGGTSTVEQSVFFTFDTTLEDLVIGWEEPEDWSPSNGMGGAGFNSTLSHEDGEGDPEPGSAMVTIPFDYTGTGQDAGLQKVHLSYPLTAEDLTGRTASASIMLVSGGSEECPISGKLFIKSGADYVWADGGAVNLTTGMWTELTLVADDPSYIDNETYDPAEINQIGIEVSPNNATTCTTTEVVVLVDTIAY